MSEDPDERADKLAGRFSSEASETGKTDQTSETNQTGKASDTSNTSKTQDGDELRVRDMESKLIYLPPEQLEELELAFEELKLRYRREHGEDLQKNKHWYPRLLAIGLEHVADTREADFDDVLDDLGLE